MRSLWGTSILILDDDDPIIATRRTFECLPDAAKVSVRITDAVELAKDALIPYLHRVEELDWRLRKTTTHELWDVLPDMALSHIVSLKLVLPTERQVGAPSAAISRKAVKLFGEASRLEELELWSDSPTPLLYDIPWQNLTKFTLHRTENPSHETELSVWARVGDTLSFRPNARLHTIFLDIKGDVLPIVLSYAFPWHQLISCHLNCYSRDHFPEILNALENCAALDFLNLHVHDGKTLPGLAPSGLQSPKRLILPGELPTSLMRCPTFWKNIRELYITLTPIGHEEFAEVARQCLYIEILSCYVSGREAVPLGFNRVELRHLHKLSLTLEDERVFDLITTPLLTQLTVHAQRFLDFVPISEYILRSQPNIRHFMYLLSQPGWQDHPIGIPRPLHSIASSGSFFARRIVLPGDVLDGIASMLLLPAVDTLVVSTSTLDDFYSMVKRRLETEAARGKVRLRVIKGSSEPGDQTSDNSLLLLLEELSKKYDVRCSFHSG
ncbi:hypothetical protein DXG01_002697 [Tephrocybe rancida]|nr:hypothetical protein DXG01_002697 [Tephrocybe rancida]